MPLRVLGDERQKEVEQPRHTTSSREAEIMGQKNDCAKTTCAVATDSAQLLWQLMEQGWAPSCSAHLLSMWADKRINTCITMAMFFAKSGCLASLALIQ